MEGAAEEAASVRQGTRASNVMPSWRLDHPRASRTEALVTGRSDIARSLQDASAMLMVTLSKDARRGAGRPRHATRFGCTPKPQGATAEAGVA